MEYVLHPTLPWLWIALIALPPLVIAVRAIPKRSKRRNVVQLTTALLLSGLAAHALAETPVLPCDGTRIEFPPVDAEPIIRIFKQADVAGWKPPACTGWPAKNFEFIGVAAASFRYNGDETELARRYGAISEYAAMRYFSPRRQTWRELSFEAFALRDAKPANKRGVTSRSRGAGSGQRFQEDGGGESRRH
jgi:hypothetical protein